jgi:hypothetical protein
METIIQIAVRQVEKSHEVPLRLPEAIALDEALTYE